MIVYVVHAGASVCILIIHTYSITQNAKIINLFIVLSQIHIVEFPAFISDTSNREFPPGSLKTSVQANFLLSAYLCEWGHAYLHRHILPLLHHFISNSFLTGSENTECIAIRPELAIGCSFPIYAYKH